MKTPDRATITTALALLALGLAILLGGTSCNPVPALSADPRLVDGDDQTTKPYLVRWAEPAYANGHETKNWWIREVYVDHYDMQGPCVVLPNGVRICGTFQITGNPSYQPR
jgi:hypothetical protein